MTSTRLRPWTFWMVIFLLDSTKRLSRYPSRWKYRLTDSKYIFFGGYPGKNYR